MFQSVTKVKKYGDKSPGVYKALWGKACWHAPYPSWCWGRGQLTNEDWGDSGS